MSYYVWLSRSRVNEHQVAVNPDLVAFVAEADSEECSKVFFVGRSEPLTVFERQVDVVAMLGESGSRVWSEELTPSHPMYEQAAGRHRA